MGEIHPKIAELLSEYQKRIAKIRIKYGYPDYSEIRRDDEKYDEFLKEIEPHLKWLYKRVEKLREDQKI